MKILLVSHTFLPKYIAGTEVYTYQLAQAFKSKQEVFVFASNPLSKKNNYKITHYDYHSIPVYCLNKNINQYRTFESNYHDTRVIAPFKRILKAIKPDIIHYQHLMHLSVEFIKIGKSLNIPQILTLNDFWFQTMMFNRINSQNKLCYNLSEVEAAKDLANLFTVGFYSKKRKSSKSLIYLINRLYHKFIKDISFQINKEKYLNMVIKRNLMMKENLALLDLIIFPTLFLFQEYCQWGIGAKKFLISSHGVNISLFKNFGRIPSNSLRFGFIGSIIPPKGLDILLKAWQKVKATNTSLKIYGNLNLDKKYKRELLSLSRNLNNVKFLGTFPPDKIADIFAEIDVLVIPSRWFENAPLVLRNALLSHTPVITPNLGSFPELIKEKNSGLLFENENVDDLASKINYIIKYPKVLKTFKFPRQKSIAENAQELVSIYKQLLQNRNEK